MKPVVGQRIEELRRRLELTQRVLAGTLSITETHLRNLITGRRELQSEHAAKLGNLAGPPDCWFWWELAGLDLKVLQHAIEENAPSLKDRIAEHLRKAEVVGERMGLGWAKKKRERKRAG